MSVTVVSSPTHPAPDCSTSRIAAGPALTILKALPVTPVGSVALTPVDLPNTCVAADSRTSDSAVEPL